MRKMCYILTNLQITVQNIQPTCIVKYTIILIHESILKSDM